MTEVTEKLLVIWTDVPDASTFEIQVTDPGEALIRGELFLMETNANGQVSSTDLQLSAALLVNAPFTVPIRQGTNLRLTLIMNYVLAVETTVTVKARVIGPNGQDCCGPLTERYTGTLGANTSRDEVSFFVVGQP